MTLFPLRRSRVTDFRDHVISHYDGLPDIGTVFAILVENKYFRAIRTHSEVIHSQICCDNFGKSKFCFDFMQSTLISYQVTLIDIGETISMPLYRSEKYQLSQDAMHLPPMAILCSVEKVRFDGKYTFSVIFRLVFLLISGQWRAGQLLATFVGHKAIRFPNHQHFRVS